MVLGIDASNIKAGGGFTHLKELLTFAEPEKFGFKKVIIYGGIQINKLPRKGWLELRVIPALEKASLLKEMLWRIRELPNLAKRECDLLFAPGGIFFSKEVKYISMSQNMLIWEKKERDRFELADRLKLRFMKFLQKKSFKNAKGIIYISDYAKGYIQNNYTDIKNKTCARIYHGINNRFRKAPKLIDFSKQAEISILYISMLHHYKFQWNVIEAVRQLREKTNLNLHLNLVGGAKPIVFEKMKVQLAQSKDFVTYHGVVPYESIESFYHDSDIFVFASTCENMPNILIEAMSSGLPIASSNYGPMPEILQDGGVYFDPDKTAEITGAIHELISKPEQTRRMMQKAFDYSKEYQWSDSADQTFSFFKDCLN